MPPATGTAARRSLRRVHGTCERDAVAHGAFVGQAMTCATSNADHQASRRSSFVTTRRQLKRSDLFPEGRIAEARRQRSSARRAKPSAAVQLTAGLGVEE